MTIWFHLPIPTSANNLTFNLKRGGRSETKDYRFWKAQAKALIMERQSKMNPRRMADGPYHVVIYVNSKVRGDIDNRIKPMVDLLVKMGVTPDDRHMAKVTCIRAMNIGKGQCIVGISPAPPGIPEAPEEAFQ